MEKVGPNATSSRPLRCTRSMEKDFVRVVLFAGAAILLSGCGYSDSHSFMPDALKLPAAPSWHTDPEPDTAQLVRANIDLIFSPQAHAQNVSVTRPRRQPEGAGWTACVRANVASIGGAAIGQRTYLISIHGGRIEDRRPATPESGCERETYQAL